MNGSKSVSLPLSYSVPQGSVLGSLIFCLYIRPLVEVIASTGLNHICYADDLQVTISFSAGEQETALRLLQSGLGEVTQWIHMNKLKLNITKTELLFMRSDAQRGRLARQEFSLQGGVIAASSSIRNLGFQLNNALTVSNQIAAMKKEINYKLHNLSRFVVV